MGRRPRMRAVEHRQTNFGGGLGSAKHSGASPSGMRVGNADPSACQKNFDKLVDGEASSPARCRASNLRFEPSAVSPGAKPENPKGFQPPCHPHQSPLKIEDFSGAEPAGKRFFLWKMRFSGAKIDPCPPYTPLGAIESSRGQRPSRALRGFFDSLKRDASCASFDVSEMFWIRVKKGSLCRRNRVRFGEKRFLQRIRCADQSVFRVGSGEAPFSKRRPSQRNPPYLNVKKSHSRRPLYRRRFLSARRPALRSKDGSALMAHSVQEGQRDLSW